MQVEEKEEPVTYNGLNKKYLLKKKRVKQVETSPQSLLLEHLQWLTFSSKTFIKTISSDAKSFNKTPKLFKKLLNNKEKVC